jgi:hypothetical protein
LSASIIPQYEHSSVLEAGFIQANTEKLTIFDDGKYNEVEMSLVYPVPINVAVYCGISPLHVPERLMRFSVPGPSGRVTWQEPGCAFGANVIGLKTPRENNAARTIAIIRIAQPYVIRYSIADCDFAELFTKNPILVCMRSHIIFKKQ